MAKSNVQIKYLPYRSFNTNDAKVVSNDDNRIGIVIDTPRRHKLVINRLARLPNNACPNAESMAKLINSDLRIHAYTANDIQHSFRMLAKSGIVTFSHVHGWKLTRNGLAIWRSAEQVKLNTVPKA